MKGASFVKTFGLLSSISETDFRAIKVKKSLALFIINPLKPHLSITLMRCFLENTRQPQDGCLVVRESGEGLR